MGHPVHGDEHGIPRIKLKESVEAGQGQRTNTYKYLRMTFNPYFGRGPGTPYIGRGGGGAKKPPVLTLPFSV